MKYFVTVTLVCLSFVMVSCTYSTKTKKARFTPLGAGPHEMIDTVVDDVKKCFNNTCETKMAHDGYEESQIKSMSNEELEEYVKKQKSKIE